MMEGLRGGAPQDMVCYQLLAYVRYIYNHPTSYWSYVETNLAKKLGG
jgi:hypothetical protein